MDSNKDVMDITENTMWIWKTYEKLKGSGMQVDELVLKPTTSVNSPPADFDIAGRNSHMKG